MSEYTQTSTDESNVGMEDWNFESALEAYEETLEACRESLASNEARERHFKGIIARLEQSVEDAAAREMQYKKALASYERALEEATSREQKYKNMIQRRESDDLNWTRAMLREVDVDQVIDSLALIKDRLQRRLLAVEVDGESCLTTDDSPGL